MIPDARLLVYYASKKLFPFSLSLLPLPCTALYRYYFCISNRIFLSFFLSYSIWGTHMILHLFILQLEASPFRGRYPKLVGGTNSDRFQPSSINIIKLFLVIAAIDFIIHLHSYIKSISAQNHIPSSGTVTPCHECSQWPHIHF